MDCSNRKMFNSLIYLHQIKVFCQIIVWKTLSSMYFANMTSGQRTHLVGTAIMHFPQIIKKVDLPNLEFAKLSKHKLSGKTLWVIITSSLHFSYLPPNPCKPGTCGTLASCCWSTVVSQQLTGFQAVLIPLLTYVSLPLSTVFSSFGFPEVATTMANVSLPCIAGSSGSKNWLWAMIPDVSVFPLTSFLFLVEIRSLSSCTLK